jgi:glycosyltransferase involved in cell wall biosynthesis
MLSGGPMSTPFVSVVIRSKDEADRLRLTLASLEGQMVDSEIIVVDDGSGDHTSEILLEASRHLPLTIIRHATPQGRSAASNAGARQARGEVLLFLDGDTLAGPDFIAQHAALHGAIRGAVGRGDTRHLRCTRLLRDPDRGVPWAEQAGAASQRPPAELDLMRVTIDQVRHEFQEIERRATPGIYPGASPRRLYDLEMETLLHAPDCGVLWSASSGSNQSVRRDAFLDAGGFNERLDNNEHRELALRLEQKGNRIRLVSGARTYHLTHRSGWRDPLKETAWEGEFLKAHPVPAVALLAVFWASLSPASPIPPECRINSLLELARAAQDRRGVDYDAARRSIDFPPLGAAFWNRISMTAAA